MVEVRIPMAEVEYCLICKVYIGKGNDPAICKERGCKEVYDYEIAFNKFAKADMKKEVS
jgi:hypothetical protein